MLVFEGVRVAPERIMMARAKTSRTREVPSTLGEWLDKWEPRVSSFKRQRRRRQVSVTAANALDELEFLLARTVENQVSE
jgi:hypothetical protein